MKRAESVHGWGDVEQEEIRKKTAITKMWEDSWGLPPSQQTSWRRWGLSPISPCRRVQSDWWKGAWLPIWDGEGARCDGTAVTVSTRRSARCFLWVLSPNPPRALWGRYRERGPLPLGEADFPGD